MAHEESCFGGLDGGSLCCSVVSGELQDDGCVNTAVIELQVDVGELSNVVNIFLQLTKKYNIYIYIQGENLSIASCASFEVIFSLFGA